MKNILIKHLVPSKLILLNLLIIVIVESTGLYFFNTGYIHLIPIIFIVIALIIYTDVRKSLFLDATLSPFFRITYSVLIIFSISHIIEYLVSQRLIPVNHDAADLLVIIFYMIIFLLILKATQNIFFLNKRKSSKTPLIFLNTLNILAILYGIYITIGRYHQTQLEKIILITTIVLVIIGVITIIRLKQLKNMLFVLKPFIKYLILTILFTILASSFEFLETIEINFIAEHQVTYITHFLIFFAIGFYILGLMELYKPTGVYADLKEYFEANK